MKGKRLFQLMKELDISDRRKLHRNCSKSKDKRSSYFKELLDGNTESPEKFIKCLGHLSRHFEHLTKKEGDKAVRRFVDFASKEIENLKLLTFLSENPKERQAVLSQIFLLRNPYLFEFYSDKCSRIAKEKGDYFCQLVINNGRINMAAQTQGSKQFKDLRKYLKEEKEINNLLYHSQLKNIFHLISSLYLDDLTILDEFKDIVPEDLNFANLIKEAPTPYTAAEYCIAQARFNYDNPEMFRQSVVDAKEKLVQIPTNSVEHQKLQRSLLHIQTVNGIHLGYSLDELTGYSDNLLATLEKLDYYDSVSFFINLMIKALNNKSAEVIQIMRERKDLYFTDENQFYCDFIKALLAFIQKDYDKALDEIQELSYAESYYVSLWSKLMEIRIHMKLGNTKLVSSLINRAKRFLDSKKNKPFTYSISKKTLSILEKKSKGNGHSEKIEGFDYFKLLID